MSDDRFVIRSRLGDYPVLFQDGPDFMGLLVARPNPVVVVDRNVYALYKDTLLAPLKSLPVYLFDAVEERKNLDEASRICQWILDTFKAKRNIDFLSVGGGITQDVTGFVASTLFRGVGWDFVPTTLLAQVDSCIGGKTSLNFGSRKNLLGTFYPPRAVHIAPVFTQTLSKLDRFSGYGEIAKFLLMRAFESGEDISAVTAEVAGITGADSTPARLIRDCLNVKRGFMESDEFDRGRRNLLNYGHCFGHALEAASGYHVPHGIAVNIGIIFANFAAAARGLISESIAMSITKGINLPLLAQRPRIRDYEKDALLANLKNDKKRTGRELPLVVPMAGGLTKLDDFTESEFVCALNQLKAVLFS